MQTGDGSPAVSRGRVGAKGSPSILATLLWAISSYGVLAVGEEVATREPAERVALFDPAPMTHTTLTKPDCPEAFFRVGIQPVLGPRAIVRPRLSIEVSADLARLLCGYEDELFRSAALRAGAHSCYVYTA